MTYEPSRPASPVEELRLAMTFDDLDAAIAFYRDALGLPVVDWWDKPNGRGIVLDAGRATIELLDARESADVDALEAGRRVSGPIRLAMRVADSADSALHLVAAGARHEGGPRVMPWGDRSVRVEGPEGIQITLFTPTMESAD